MLLFGEPCQLSPLASFLSSLSNSNSPYLFKSEMRDSDAREDLSFVAT